MGQEPDCTICSTPFHRTGGPVAMVMQYFSSIAHIDLQRRKRLSRSEKKMCACKRVCVRAREKWGGDGLKEEKQGVRTKVRSSLVPLSKRIKTCHLYNTTLSPFSVGNALTSVARSGQAPSVTWSNKSVNVDACLYQFTNYMYSKLLFSHGDAHRNNTRRKHQSENQQRRA